MSEWFEIIVTYLNYISVDKSCVNTGHWADHFIHIWLVAAIQVSGKKYSPESIEPKWPIWRLRVLYLVAKLWFTDDYSWGLQLRYIQIRVIYILGTDFYGFISSSSTWWGIQSNVSAPTCHAVNTRMNCWVNKSVQKTFMNRIMMMFQLVAVVLIFMELVSHIVGWLITFPVRMSAG